MPNRTSPAENLIRNLKMLLAKTGMPKTELAKKSGIGVRTIYCILSRERGASIQMADDLAQAFRLSGWDIIRPDLDYDLAKTGHIDSLIKNYSLASPRGRETIDAVAESAPKYCTATRKKKYS